MVEVKCFNYSKCRTFINVADYPVKHDGDAIYPRVQQAVWICDNCRQDSKALKAARSAMFKRLLEVDLNARNPVA